MNSKDITVSLSAEEQKVLQQRIDEKKDFDSIEAYVKDIISQVISKLKDDQQDQGFSEEDEEKVKERLKSLGYLD